LLCCWLLPLPPLLLQVRKGNRSQSFYTLPEYEAWKESLANTRDANGWDIKYYKGELRHANLICSV
jgi:DNA topoisomerase-2